MQRTQFVPGVVATTFTVVLLLLMVLFGGLPSRSSAAGTAAQAGSPGVLKFATFNTPQTFDPAKYTGGKGGLLYLYPVYDSLLRTDPKGEIVPGLATSWTSRTDGVLLKLRRGVRFTDGAPFNADAVKQNVMRCKQIGGSCGTTMGPVKSAVVIDPYTVLLRTVGPRPALVWGLTAAAGMMVSPRAFDSPDLGRRPVGVGGYVLDPSATVEGSKYVYAKAKTPYWDSKTQTLNGIEIHVIRAAQQRVNALRTGQINASMIGDAQELASYKAAGIKTSISPTGDPFAMLVLDPTGPFADVRVRQALGYAINREALTQGPFRKGLATVSNQLFPKGHRGYVPKPSFSYAYDPDKAKSLLQQAGATNLSFTIPAQPGPQNLIETQAVAGMLNAVGFNAKVVQPPPQGILNEIYSGKYPVAYTPIFTPDAASLADAVAPQGYMNPKHYTDPQVQQLAKQARIATVKAPAKAGKLWGQLMARLASQGLVIPTFFSPVGVAYSDDVSALNAWAENYNGPPFWGVKVTG